MRTPYRLFLLALIAGFTLSLTPSATAQFWNPFRSKKTVERPVEQTSFQAPAVGDADSQLKEQSGPWLIMATTFSGEGAEGQAQDLAQELHRDHGLPAYVHPITFDFTGGNETLGRGLDKYGAPIKMRYRSGEKTSGVGRPHWRLPHDRRFDSGADACDGQNNPTRVSRHGR